MKDKGIEANIKYYLENDEISYQRKKETIIFDLTKMEIKGTSDIEIEDFRDYLRRNGIKFFTKNKFQSIIPPSFQRFKKVKK